MTAVGRNDPCPCGSGKKYKHCHWRIDQQAQREAIQWERAVQSITQKVWEYARQERFGVDMVSAWQLFWDSRMPFEAITSIDEIHRIRFLDWFFFDYRTSHQRKRVAELYLETHSSDLSQIEKQVLEKWLEAYLSVYEIKEIAPDHLDLQDIFTGQSKIAHESGMSEYLQPGVLLYGRLRAVREQLHFAPGVLPMPGEEKEPLLEFIRPRFEAWQQARYGAGWRDFLKEAGYQINHFLVRELEPVPDMVAPEPEMDPVEAAQAIVRRMQSRIITGPLDVFYEKWIDEPVPEWQDKTPRQMAQTTAGQEMLEVFLDVLEDAERRRAELGQPAYDVSLLRRKLGLTDEVRTESGIILPR